MSAAARLAGQTTLSTAVEAGAHRSHAAQHAATARPRHDSAGRMEHSALLQRGDPGPGPAGARRSSLSVRAATRVHPQRCGAAHTSPRSLGRPSSPRRTSRCQRGLSAACARGGRVCVSPVRVSSGSARPAPPWRYLFWSRAGPRQPMACWWAMQCLRRGQWLSCHQPKHLREHGGRQSVPPVCRVAAEQTAAAQRRTHHRLVSASGMGCRRPALMAGPSHASPSTTASALAALFRFLRAAHLAASASLRSCDRSSAKMHKRPHYVKNRRLNSV